MPPRSRVRLDDPLNCLALISRSAVYQDDVETITHFDDSSGGGSDVVDSSIVGGSTTRGKGGSLCSPAALSPIVRRRCSVYSSPVISPRTRGVGSFLANRMTT